MTFVVDSRMSTTKSSIGRTGGGGISRVERMSPKDAAEVLSESVVMVTFKVVRKMLPISKKNLSPSVTARVNSYIWSEFPRDGRGTTSPVEFRKRRKT